MLIALSQGGSSEEVNNLAARLRHHYSHPGGTVGAATTLPAPVEPLEIPHLNADPAR
jgi:hypothetical protein